MNSIPIGIKFAGRRFATDHTENYPSGRSLLKAATPRDCYMIADMIAGTGNNHLSI
jgi:hypothetical protein